MVTRSRAQGVPTRRDTRSATLDAGGKNRRHDGVSHIPHDVVVLIGNQAECPKDLVRWSAVCKTWEAAILKARPPRLSLRHHGVHCDQARLEGAPRWLQAYQFEGQPLSGTLTFGDTQLTPQVFILDSCQYPDHESISAEDSDHVDSCQYPDHESISAEDSDHEDIVQSTSSFQIANWFAGFWKLQQCRLRGGFCLDRAVSALPASITQLYLHPDESPKSIMMSAFQRFRKLQLLSLDGPGDCDDSRYSFSEEEYPDDLSMFLAVLRYDLFDKMYEHATCDLILDSTFDSLQTLKLEGTFCCCLANEVCMDVCLPSLESFSTSVVGHPEGILLAQEIAMMPKLQELNLKVRSFHHHFLCATLRIPSSSLIQHLKIKGPRYRSPKLILKIEKGGVSCEASRLESVDICCSTSHV